MTRKRSTLLSLFLAIAFIFTMIGPSYAAVTDIVVQGAAGDTNLYQYDYAELNASYMNYLMGDTAGATLYLDFMNKTYPPVAFKDSEKGYVDYNDVSNAYMNALMSGSDWNTDNYTSTLAAPADMPPTVKATSVIGGEITTVDTPTSTTAITITAVTAIDPKTVDVGTGFKSLGLPTTNKVTYSDGTTADLAISEWGGDKYEKDIPGVYNLLAVLTLPTGVTYGEGVTGPTCKVTVADPQAAEGAVAAYEAAAITTAEEITAAEALEVIANEKVAMVADADKKAAFEARIAAKKAAVDAAKAALGKPVVSSVSAINATTVEVTLAEVPAAVPAAGDFAVLVDGAAVEVSAVAKKPNTEKTYNLTIASLNGKEGQLSVNGTAAAIPGSDFGYDFKAPTVASVAGIDSNHVQIVFSEKVDKANAETIGNYDVTKLDETSLAVTLATLQADGKSVLLTTTTAMDTFANGYIAVVKTGVKDVKGNAFAADTKTIFSGVGTAPTTGPVALSAVYTPSATGKIVVKFDKDINATVDKTKITVGGAALALGDSAARTGTAELTITLTAASKTAYDAAATKDVVFAAGAVKDTATKPNDIAATTVTVVEAAKLVTATYAEDTNILVLNFSSPVQITKLDLANIQVNGKVITGGKVKETGNNATVTIDLTGIATLNAIETALKANRSVEIKASAGMNLDANGNAIAQAVYKTEFTYTDDDVAPTLVSAAVNATTQKMVITFSEPVTVTNNNMIEVYNGTTKLFDLSIAGDVASVTPVKSTLEVVLTSGGGNGIDKIKAIADKSNLSVKVLKTTSGGTEAVIDAAGNKFSKEADASVALAYTDQDAVKYFGLPLQTGLATNQVKVTFDKSIATADLTTGNFMIFKADNPTITVPVTKVVGADGNRQIILTMDDTSANFVVGYTYIVKSTAKDIYGNPVETPTSVNASFTLAASTATAYKLTNAVYADTNGDYKANAGDQITLTFEGAVSISGDVTATDFVVGAVYSLGTFTIAAGNQPEQLVITLGTGANLNLGTTTFNITATDADKHIVGANGKKVDPAAGAITLVKPDLAGPKVVSAKYYDANGNGIQDAGDTLEIVFNKAITNAAVDMGAAAAGNTFVLSAGDLLLDGTKASVTEKTLLIEIKTVNTAITPGTTTINGAAASANIKDLWENNLQAGDAKIIAKSDTAQPTFSNVRIVKGTGTAVVLEVYDKVVFDISEAVHLDATPNLDALKFYAGPTEIKYATDNSGKGFGGNGNGAGAAQVNVDNSAKTVTITINNNDGWIGATISALSTFNIDTLGKKTFFDANGNQVKTETGFGLPVTTP